MLWELLLALELGRGMVQKELYVDVLQFVW